MGFIAGFSCNNTLRVSCCIQILAASTQLQDQTLYTQKARTHPFILIGAQFPPSSPPPPPLLLKYFLLGIKSCSFPLRSLSTSSGNSHLVLYRHRCNLVPASLILFLEKVSHDVESPGGVTMWVVAMSLWPRTSRRRKTCLGRIEDSVAFKAGA